MSDIFKLLLYAVGIAIALTFVQRNFFPKIETRTVTETVIDTTLVDSLYTVIERLEDIPEPERDTVFVTADISEPVVRDSLRTYYTGLSDPLININVESNININTSSLISQQISYILKQRLVREQRTELTYNIREVTTITTTRTINRSYVSVGAIINLDSITPAVAYTSRNNTTFLFGYDITNDHYSAGILVPLF